MVDLHYTPKNLDGPVVGKVAVMSTRWNPSINEGLVDGYKSYMEDHEGVETSFFEVSGAWEIPLMADKLAASGEYGVLVALGCVVRGKTSHYELITDSVARGCMTVQLKRGVPIVFEVLAVDDFHQAEQRSSGDLNAGRIAAMTVLELLDED
jgi:6,7-dimethyl-8-ribityllumazine synthase